jgi:polysaccharide export outer membrane protein
LGSKRVALIVVALLACVLSGCDLPDFGPTRHEINAAAKPDRSGNVVYALVDLNSTIAATMATWRERTLHETFGDPRPPARQLVGRGDVLKTTIWESSTGGLFSDSSPVERNTAGARSATIPEQTVGPDGAISVPYAGRVPAAGLTTTEIEHTIVKKLQGKAIEPQALVTITKNVASTVTVIGEITNGAKLPLALNGDRVLDVIAQAGGIRAPANEVVVTLMRRGRSASVPLQVILSNASENIYVHPQDVITVAREPQTFVAAGGLGKNSIVPFDTLTLSLDEAIAKGGGINDTKGDPTGVYVIRYETAAHYDGLRIARPTAEASGEVPVIYRLNMRDPNAFFISRRFPMQDKDIVYVASAPATELQKVLSLLGSFLVPAGTVVAVGAVAR